MRLYVEDENNRKIYLKEVVSTRRELLKKFEEKVENLEEENGYL